MKEHEGVKVAGKHHEPKTKGESDDHGGKHNQCIPKHAEEGDGHDSFRPGIAVWIGLGMTGRTVGDKGQPDPFGHEIIGKKIHSIYRHPQTAKKAKSEEDL